MACRLADQRVGAAVSVGVGTRLAPRPLHRSGRAALPHPAPTLGDERQALVGIRMTDGRGGEGSPRRSATRGSRKRRSHACRKATNVRIEHPVHSRGDPLLPVLARCLSYPLEARRRVCPALRPGVVVVARVPLGPPASLDRLRGRLPGVVRRRPRYYQAVRLLAVVHHRRTSIDFPMRPAALLAAEDRETSRFPNAVLLRGHGVSDRAGFHRASRWRHAGCGLPLLPTASAPRRFMNFAAQYPARTFPCQRFDGAVTHADA